MVLLCNPTLANITITAPAASKTYIVINTSATYTVTIRGVGPTTGIIIPASDRALVVWNGSDFVRVGSSAGGLNTQVQYNNSGNLAGSANLTFNGTTLTANTLNLTNALGAVYGGTGLTSVGAVGNVLISNGTTWVSSSLNTGAQAFVTQATGGNQPPGAFSPSDSFALI
jgi:hypothetical protein